MTVAELIARLQTFPPEMEVKALWDCTPYFDVHRIELFQGTALLDCGTSDGDWDVIESDIKNGRLTP